MRLVLRYVSILIGLTYALSLVVLARLYPEATTEIKVSLIGVGFALLLLVLASAVNAREWGVLAVGLCFGLGGVGAFYLFGGFAEPTTLADERTWLRYAAAGAIVTAAVEAALLTDWGRQWRKGRE